MDPKRLRDQAEPRPDRAGRPKRPAVARGEDRCPALRPARRPGRPRPHSASRPQRLETPRRGSLRQRLARAARGAPPCQVSARWQAAGGLAAGPLEQCRPRSPDTGPQRWDPAQAEPRPDRAGRPKRPAVAQRRGPVSGAATGPPARTPAAHGASRHTAARNTRGGDHGERRLAEGAYGRGYLAPQPELTVHEHGCFARHPPPWSARGAPPRQVPARCQAVGGLAAGQDARGPPRASRATDESFVWSRVEPRVSFSPLIHWPAQP